MRISMPRAAFAAGASDAPAARAAGQHAQAVGDILRSASRAGEDRRSPRA
jgi:hypothetical protein